LRAPVPSRRQGCVPQGHAASHALPSRRLRALSRVPAARRPARSARAAAAGRRVYVLMQAMILAAGRGERMRPLSDATPKPLLEVGGKPLTGWQLERLVAAGFREIVINVAHRAEAIVSALGDGSRLGVAIAYSREPQPLEVAGGISTALPLLGDGVALIVSGDLYTEYDYATLIRRALTMAGTSAPPHVHMVMVSNPAYHPAGDFALADGRLALDGTVRST